MTQGLIHLAARLAAGGSVYAEEEAALLLAEAQSPQQLEHMVAVRLLGQPLEYVLGWACFAGIRVAVEPGVFVPRVRTELLVREAVARVPPHRAIIVDVCCGSGAVEAAVLAHLPAGRRAELHSADSDPAAVRCARHNLPTDATCYLGDLYEPLPASLAGRVDLIVANAPYVPSRAVAHLPREARLYEAPAALDGGPDGLDVLRRVAAGAPARLAAGGHVLVEASPPQAPAVAAVFESHGLSAEVILDSDRDAAAMVGTLRLRVSAAAAG